jgi:hypothetical protein
VKADTHMDYLIHKVVLLGILALLLFGPRRSGHRQSPAARAASRVFFILACLAFAMSFLWWLIVGDKLPLQVG